MRVAFDLLGGRDEQLEALIDTMWAHPCAIWKRAGPVATTRTVVTELHVAVDHRGRRRIDPKPAKVRQVPA